MKIINNTECLSFQLKTYNENIPIFQVILDFFYGINGTYEVILDFFTEMGGIY